MNESKRTFLVWLMDAIVVLLTGWRGKRRDEESHECLTGGDDTAPLGVMFLQQYHGRRVMKYPLGESCKADFIFNEGLRHDREDTHPLDPIFYSRLLCELENDRRERHGLGREWSIKFYPNLG